MPNETSSSPHRILGHNWKRGTTQSTKLSCETAQRNTTDGRNPLVSTEQGVTLLKYQHTWVACLTSVVEAYTNILDKLGILDANIRQEATNVGPPELFPYRFKVISGSGIIVTKEKAVFAIDVHASFVVDDSVDAKESS